MNELGSRLCSYALPLASGVAPNLIPNSLRFLAYSLPSAVGPKTKLDAGRSDIALDVGYNTPQFHQRVAEEGISISVLQYLESINFEKYFAKGDQGLKNPLRAAVGTGKFKLPMAGEMITPIKPKKLKVPVMPLFSPSVK